MMDRPFLTSERLYLRPLEVEDVNEEYLQWMNNAALSGFIPAMTFPGTRHAVEEYVRRETRNPHVVFLAIIEKETNKHIGNIKLCPINWLDRHAEYGRLIGDPGARGKGYGTEVADTIIRYAFDVLGMHKVYASCLAPNKAAIRSNEKCGLKVEGVLRERRFVGGEFVDVAYMGVKREEFEEAVKRRQ